MDKDIVEFLTSIGIEIPIYLQNILKYAGYDTFHLLSELTDDDIKSLEKFTREDLNQLLGPQDDKKDFFGIFHNNVDIFKIVPGHKKLLLEAALKLKLRETENRRKLDLNQQKLESENLKDDQDKSAPPTALQNQEFSEICKQILSTQKAYIANLFANHSDYEKRLSQINKIEVKVLKKNERMTGVISCPFCDKETNLSWFKQKENYNARPVYGNYHFHIKKHLEKDNKGKESLHIPKSRPRPRLITSFFTAASEAASNRPPNSNLDAKITENKQKMPESNIIVHENILLKKSANSKNVDWSTYSRNNRMKRKLDAASSDNTFITEYFPILNQIEYLFKQNKELENTLVSNISKVRADISFSKERSIRGVLRILCDTAVRNNDNSNSSANRYDEVLKKFCSSLYLIGGRLTYQTIQGNLPNSIPSITTLQRFLSSNERILEGQIRLTQLKSFLVKRGYPMNVWISEDQTRIVSTNEYDSVNNRIVGFTTPYDENGCPIINSFIAGSATEIQSYFNSESTANNLYAIVAQPLVVDSPSFTLCVFASNNKFSFDIVLRRWNYIETEAKKLGIVIEGFSSDGDTRMLKAMKIKSVLPCAIEDKNCDWFQANFDCNRSITIQDTIHIGTKLRNRLLSPSIILPMGKFLVSVAHLKVLIDSLSKDKHLLTETDINPTDKMNSRSVDKIIHEKVTDLLEKHVTDSDATVAYLKIIRYILESFSKNNLSVSERIYKIWFSTLFIRIWKCWIAQETSYTTSQNFITNNCYNCIELNAHGLILIVKKFKNEDRENQFIPWLMNSQSCEKLFRTLRSMTSVFSTVVNFSMLDVLRRLSRINFLNDIITDLSKCVIKKFALFINKFNFRPR